MPKTNIAHFLIFSALCPLFFIVFLARPTHAKQVLGVHILHPTEIPAAADLIKNEHNADLWSYVTLPLTLDDLHKKDDWQQAFNHAHNLKIIPIIRLASRFDPEKNYWTIPTRADIIRYFQFLNSLTWPHDNKFIIVFNEPNHFNEWGGVNDPASYARLLQFTANWAHTENNNYRILPAAMDLAAPNSPDTTEAFTFLNAMLQENPDVFTTIDYWNSHSYPNPAFSAAPTKTGQNSLRGFEHELDWLEEKTGLTPKVFITETGWEENYSTRNNLNSYYTYANTNIWSNERVVAVTPFVLKGDPGPFSKFTLLDKNDNPRTQYHAYAKEILKNALEIKKELDSISVASF